MYPMSMRRQVQIFKTKFLLNDDGKHDDNIQMYMAH